MAHKIHTIHHNGIAFFKDKEHSLYCSPRFSFPDLSQIIFEGLIDEMTFSKAMRVAEVHPNFEKYNELAMATLFKTYTFKSGTENPILALKTKRSKKERDEDYKYVVIWRIFGD